jgi:hypothetical protein
MLRHLGIEVVDTALAIAEQVDVCIAWAEPHALPYSFAEGIKRGKCQWSP